MSDRIRPALQPILWLRLPSFWLGLVLLAVFSIWLGVTPDLLRDPSRHFSRRTPLFWQKLHHLILPGSHPVACIGVAQIALHTREKMIDAMNSDYALFAFAPRAKHALAWPGGTRSAMSLCLRSPSNSPHWANSSEVRCLPEQVFSYPGLGKATVEAGIRGDVPSPSWASRSSAPFSSSPATSLPIFLYGVLRSQNPHRFGGGDDDRNHSPATLPMHMDTLLGKLRLM